MDSFRFGIVMGKISSIQNNNGVLIFHLPVLYILFIGGTVPSIFRSIMPSLSSENPFKQNAMKKDLIKKFALLTHNENFDSRSPS
jgi:hypothetical protein